MVNRNILYLAYGSNIGKREMQHRCPSAILTVKGYLTGYALEFRGGRVGFLTIKKERNGRIPISLWKVTDQDEKYLDKYEGLGHLYYKKELECIIDGNKYYCFAYIMYEKKFKAALPSYDYLIRCASMYHEEGFKKDISLLDQAVKDVNKRKGD